MSAFTYNVVATATDSKYKIKNSYLKNSKSVTQDKTKRIKEEKLFNRIKTPYNRLFC